jgi:hypothetical protein
MILRSVAFHVFLALSVTVALASARAQDVDVLGTFKDWTAYSTKQAGKRLCYMASEPKKDEGKYKKRGRMYAMVSHRPATKAKNVVSIHAGYKYKEGSSVTVKIGGRKFTLFTHGDTAWASTEADDRVIVKAMRAGSNMQVRGVSWRDTKTTDVYSLLGFSAAYREISRACKVR